jgi:hypothetical protein
MKLHFSLAAAAALLCAAPITSAYDDADVVQVRLMMFRSVIYGIDR